MPPVGFEPTISAGERPQTYALDHVATGIGVLEVGTIIWNDWNARFWDKKKTTASNVPIVAIDVTTSLSLTGNRDWVLCIEYEVFI